MIDQFIAANGITLRVRADGPADAPALLLCNSLGTRLEMWDMQMPNLTREYRVIRFDNRGHGLSEAPEAEYAIEDLGLDALGVLDYFAIERAHFCGLSMGGMVGQWLGTNAGHRLNKLVLSNTAAYMGPPSGWSGRMALVAEHGMSAITEAVVERWFTEDFRRDHDDRIEPIRAMLLSTKPHGYVGCCAAIRDMDQRTTIAAIDVPTLVIGGLYDPATPPACSEEIAGAVTGAELVMLPAAHLANVECVEEYTAALLGFLRGA